MPSPLRRGPEAISPTAYYTGEVWARHGLGPRELATRPGRVLHLLGRPANAAIGALGGPTLDGLLLGRHHALDALLRRAIDTSEVTQVVELAAGMSPRGRRFCEEYGDRVDVVEVDLPAMAERKRRALARLPTAGRHRVVGADVLREDGPGSLTEVVDSLDPAGGIAVVAEGLLNYLPAEAVTSLWRRLAALTTQLPRVLHVTDLHLASTAANPVARTFVPLLGSVVGGGVHLHFPDATSAREALLASGFTDATVHRCSELGTAYADAAGARLVHIVEARAGDTTGPA